MDKRHRYHDGETWIEIADASALAWVLEVGYRKVEALDPSTNTWAPVEVPFEEQIGHDGFKVKDLRAAFEKIQNATNWKLEIEAVVPRKDLRLYNAAAVFFAGCTLTVGRAFSRGMVAVYGVGYYRAVGA